jgi:hypothetical protein
MSYIAADRAPSILTPAHFVFALSQELSKLAAQHQKVVAVVGAAHVPGITKRFANHTLWAINAEGKPKAELLAKCTEVLKASRLQPLMHFTRTLDLAAPNAFRFRFLRGMHELDMTDRYVSSIRHLLCVSLSARRLHL